MGFFSWFKKKISSVGHAIGRFITGAKNDVSSVASTVGHDVNNVVNTAKGAVTTVFNTAKSGITTVYNDAKSGAKTVYKTTTGMAKKVESDTIGKHGIINNTESNIKSIVTIPLILIGVAVIFVGYNSKTNANLSASYNR